MKQQTVLSKEPNDISVAALLTCHNRCEQTASCLRGLISAYDYFHKNSLDGVKIMMEIYLTDDGCTDNTTAMAEAVTRGKMALHIIKGDGQLYWSNGMIVAWREAMRREWDFFLLLNDDTNMFDYALAELMRTFKYSLEKSPKPGIYSGITCDIADHAVITYGGYRWTNKFAGRKTIMLPSDTPQLCDMANANILLVSKGVVDEIGIFYDGYEHGAADYDYSHMAQKKGLPVMVTARVCGTCEYNHSSDEDTNARLCTMSYRERKAYLNNPLHSIRDYLVYTWRCTPARFPLVLCGRYISLWFPKAYKIVDLARRRIFHIGKADDGATAN